jgi:DNA primase
LNRTLSDVTLVLEKRKPFDLLAERPLLKIGRGDWRSFEPHPDIVVPFVAPFLGPPDPYLITAAVTDTVYICEGEKDVDNVGDLGLTATCNVGGAGKWRPEYNAFMAGRSVVILAHKDEPGRRHAAQVAASLRPVAKSVKVIELPGDGVKDASDWIAAGGRREKLAELAGAAPEWTPTSTAAPAAPATDNRGDSTPPAAAGSATSGPRACTDTGNAERFADRFGSRARYCWPWAKWLVWTGRCWKVNAEDRVRASAKQTVRSIWTEAAAESDPDRRKALGEWAGLT